MHKINWCFVFFFKLLRLNWHLVGLILPVSYRQRIRASNFVCRLWNSRPDAPGTLEMEISYWKERFSEEGSSGFAAGEVGNEPILRLITQIRDNAFFCGKIVLDIGCGPRGSICWISEASIRLGIDPLAVRYRSFGTAQHNMRYVCALGEGLPLKNNSIDFACSFYALHYTRDIASVFFETLRVLKTGGLFVGSCKLVPHPDVREPTLITREMAQKVLFRGWEVEYSGVFPEGQTLGNEHTYRFLHETPPPRYTPAYELLCWRLRKK